MEFVVSKKRNRIGIKGDNAVSRIVAQPAYEKKISLYKIPPTEEITVQEFETFALDRMRVLKEIDACRIRGLKGNDFNNRIREIISKYLKLDTPEDIRKDVISHFALRFAYCKPADRKWFLQQEIQLLKFRLKEVNIGAFLRENNLEYSIISPEEYKELEALLLDVSADSVLKSTMYFKVPFEQALDLIRLRKCLLKKGLAYVNEEDFSSILAAQYRQHLSECLANANKIIANVAAKYDTIAPILSNLSTMYLENDYKPDASKRTGKVELSQIEMLSKRSFPMCMRNLHENLKSNHHLKHMGRMQYGLFLKGIGLTLEDALVFWRSEFSRIMGVDKFEKNYSYNIRHNYGREGRRTDYTPYSCVKIIMGNVNSGENHGCPFKHFDQEHMKAKLQSQGVSRDAITEILDLIENKHYQIACRRHFEVTHPNCEAGVTINHPNQYFDLSEKYFNEGARGSATQTTDQLITNNNNNSASVTVNTIDASAADNSNNNNNNDNNNNNNNAFDDEMPDSELLKLDV